MSPTLDVNHAHGKMSSSPDLSSPSQARVRPRHVHKWKKCVAKKRRNQGQEYVSERTGKSVAARTIGRPCSCRKKCFHRVGEENIKDIFDNYWNSGSWDLQTVYLQKLTSINKIKSKPKCSPSRQRTCARIYTVKASDQYIEVCKTAFVSIHGISRSRLDNALFKVTATGMPVLDLRGKHDAHPHIAEAKLRLANTHIASFPTISSHYSRKDMPNAKYLEDGIINKMHMYKLYTEWIREDYSEEEPVALHCYLDIIKKKFPNLKFYKIRKDTCNICDSYKIKISDKDLSEEDKNKLEDIHKIHLEKAEAGYNLPLQLVTHKPNATIVCMDLQQALPTPKLSTNLAFYKIQKMYTYNFNIYDYRKAQGYMFLWDETTAKRGAIEIISNLDKYINNFVSSYSRELIIFSDNCSGQNKNYYLMTYYMYLIHKGRFDLISHIYFQVGHTYMAADGNFGQIEISIRQRNYIFSPLEYVEIIKNCRNSEESQFKVTHMKLEDYKDWEIIAKHTTKRKCNINFSKCCYFRFDKDYKLGYGCGDTYSKYLNQQDIQVSMVKGRTAAHAASFNLSSLQIPQKYMSPIPLSPEKRADLLVLVSEWVPPAIKRSYWDSVLSLQSDANNNDVSTGNDHPDTTTQNDQENENELDDEVDNSPESEEPLLAVRLFEYN